MLSKNDVVNIYLLRKQFGSMQRDLFLMWKEKEVWLVLLNQWENWIFRWKCEASIIFYVAQMQTESIFANLVHLIIHSLFGRKKYDWITVPRNAFHRLLSDCHAVFHDHFFPFLMFTIFFFYRMFLQLRRAINSLILFRNRAKFDDLPGSQILFSICLCLLRRFHQFQAIMQWRLAK